MEEYKRVKEAMMEQQKLEERVRLEAEQREAREAVEEHRPQIIERNRLLAVKTEERKRREVPSPPHATPCLILE